MTYLIRGILLVLILMAALTADAQESATTKCRDQELEVACKTALEAADELMQQKDAKTLYLENMLEMQLSQQEMQSKLMLDLINPPWYRDYRYTFLLGIIAGGILNESIRRP